MGQEPEPSRTAELAAAAMFAESEEEFNEITNELNSLPREPGTYRVSFAGAPRSVPVTEVDCPDCGRKLRTGGGVAFGDWECPQHPATSSITDCMGIHMHWSEDCPAWKHRRWRLWHHHTWGRVERRWYSYKWRRRRKKERADPVNWVEYWKKLGKPDDLDESNPTNWFDREDEDD